MAMVLRGGRSLGRKPGNINNNKQQGHASQVVVPAADMDKNNKQKGGGGVTPLTQVAPRGLGAA